MKRNGRATAWGYWARAVVAGCMVWMSALWLPAAQAATMRAPFAPPGDFAFHAAASADGLIVVHTYGRPAGFAARILALAQADLRHPIADTLGFTLRRRVDIYVYNSRRDFLAGAQPGNAAETGAFAVPAQSAIYLPVAGANATAVQDFLPHELTHIVFHQNEDAGVYGGTIFPRWLDEGNAAYDQLPDSAEAQQYAWTLQAAARSHALLDIFTSFNATYPTDPAANFLAYAEARSFVGYLIGTYGAAAYHRFLRAARDGDLILAAEVAFGADLRALQSRWLVSLGQMPALHDAGYAPQVAPATPFVMGTTPALAATLHPFPFAQSALLLNLFAMCLLWLLVELALIAVVEVMVQRVQPPGSVARRPLRLRWEHLGVGLIAPAVLLSGIAWARFAPDHSWSHASVMAALVAFVLLTILLAANWGAILQRRISAAWLAGVLTAVLLAAFACVSARPLAWQQARAYALSGAYALALQSAQEAGAPQGTQAQLHIAWAAKAQSAGDWQTAARQLRAALALTPSTDATAADLRARLSAVTLTWGRGLTGAHHYADAVAIYAGQLNSGTCDGACHSLLGDAASRAYLAWGDALLLSGDSDAALAKYQIVARQFGTSAAAAAARQALREIPAMRQLQSALAAGAAGDIRAMNAQLRAILQHQPATAAASQVAEMPQPVRGRVINRDGSPATGWRVYFMAFAQKTDARSYHYDRVLFTVAATCGPRGAFSVLLPAGYWYAIFWEDPRRPQSFNAPPGGSGIFFVRPLTPLAVGTFVGA